MPSASGRAGMICSARARRRSTAPASGPWRCRRSSWVPESDVVAVHGAGSSLPGPCTGLLSLAVVVRHHRVWPDRHRPWLWGKGPGAWEYRLLAAGAQQADRGGEGKARMIQRPAVVAARTARAVRGLWPDRNPLRRTMDRVEAVVIGGLVVAFLAAAPLVLRLPPGTPPTAWPPALPTRSRPPGVRCQRCCSLPPKLRGTASTRRPYKPGGPPRTGRGIPARCSHPRVPGPAGTVTVWVDKAGRLTGDSPLQLSQVRGRAALATMFTPLAVGFILLCAGLLAHATPGRRRLAAWDTDWQVTEPQWTKRR